MSRYIDADELGASVIKNTVFDKGDVIKLIEDTPSIEIIRCRECKYWRNKNPQQIPTASIMCGHMHPDDFCSYGEREGE